MRNKAVLRSARSLLAALGVVTLVACGEMASDSSTGKMPTPSPTSASVESTTAEPTPTESVSTEPSETETTEAGLLAPDDAKDLEGDNYEDVVEDFEELGFTNVSTEKIEDLIIGFLVEDGEIEEVTIDGDDDFDNETPYAPDVEVVITYHTFPDEDDDSDDEEEPSAEEPQETLTIQNNTDLAKLLRNTDDCSAAHGRFAQKYAGRKIRFDGYVADMAQHGSYDTRFDLLILAGDFDPDSFSGPNFKYEDVNMSYDMHWSGANQPDYVREGDEFTFTARIDKYVARTCLFFIEPVRTQVR